MSWQAEEELRKDAAWDHVARSEDFRCAICAKHPILNDKEIYFKHQLCGDCLAEQESATP